MTAARCTKCGTVTGGKLHICKAQKQRLGQFFTTAWNHILQGFVIPTDVQHIIEPFTGAGDLLNFIKDRTLYRIDCYDIEPRTADTVQRDTLLNPPSYQDAFVLTNPPYLARNKCNDKTVFNRYNVNDLFKAFLKELTTNACKGGIVIVPLNFWSSIRKADIALRKAFLQCYRITRLNIFEEQVFDDTSYTVCSFQFERKPDPAEEAHLKIVIYPSEQTLNVTLTDGNNYLIGGEIYNLPVNPQYTITRLTHKNLTNAGRTNIVMKCMDDNSRSRISLQVVADNDVVIDQSAKLTARSYGTLVIEPPLTLDRQHELVNAFNNYLNNQREQYHSLFLTNYRESKDLARKRISFELVYQIVGYLLR